MSLSTNQFKNGMAFLYDGELYMILEFQHVKPGKGAAFVRTKIKSVRTGKILDRTFDSGAKFEEAYIDKKTVQFQYKAGDTFHFMDLESYEERVYSREDLGDAANFLLENMEVRAESYKGKLLGLELPTTVTLKVTDSDPGLQGDTSKSAMKPATVETGHQLKVPLFVGPGDLIKVDTRTGEYAGRA